MAKHEKLKAAKKPKGKKAKLRNVEDVDMDMILGLMGRRRKKPKGK